MAFLPPESLPHALQRRCPTLSRTRFNALPDIVAGSVAALALAAASGCVDSSTEPVVAASSATASVDVSCKASVLTKAEAYATRGIVLRAPASVASAGGNTAPAVAFRWKASVPWPIAVISCEIPETPSAAAWFARAYGESDKDRAREASARAEGVVLSFRTSQTSPPMRSLLHGAIMGGQAEAPTISPLVVNSYGDFCEGELSNLANGEGTASIDDGCTCEEDQFMLAVLPSGQGVESLSSFDDGCFVEDEADGPPEGSTDESGDSSDDRGDDDLQIVTNSGQTFNPHNSSHVPGTINVEARTTSSISEDVISVEVTLWGRKCSHWPCIWAPVAFGSKSRSGNTVTANAARGCRAGWYRGYSHHFATTSYVFPDYHAISTSGTFYLTCDF